MSEKTVERQVRIAKQPFRLRSRDVARTLRTLEPEPIASHFVVVGGRRFPPKQVICAVTGLDRADFTTHQARRTLMRLGFSVGRQEAGGPSGAPAAAGGSAAQPAPDRLGQFAGQWVAIKGGQVLFAAASPQELVGWLGRQGQKADSVFRVPDSEVSATGLAPL